MTSLHNFRTFRSNVQSSTWTVLEPKLGQIAPNDNKRQMRHETANLKRGSTFDIRSTVKLQRSKVNEIKHHFFQTPPNIIFDEVKHQLFQTPPNIIFDEVKHQFLTQSFLFTNFWPIRPIATIMSPLCFSGKDVSNKTKFDLKDKGQSGLYVTYHSIRSDESNISVPRAFVCHTWSKSYR